MIKKARDIQLGDRIGGRLVARLWHTTDSYTVFAFADDLGEGSVCVRPEEDVWVDDPAPCCKPTLIDVKASEVKAGDIVCFKMQRVNKSNFDYYAMHWSDDPNDTLTFKEFETVQILKEALIEP